MNEPIRVAQVIGKLSSAGVEAVVNNYYRNIDHNKIQFDYYIDADSICEPPQELIDMGARYFVIPPYQKLPQYMASLVKHFKEQGYSIVHIHMNSLACFALCAAWLVGVPVRINHNHSTASKGETKRNILKYMLRPFAKIFATDYCACSKLAGEWLFGKRSMEKGEVTVWNNAIDISKYEYNADIRARKRAELGIADDKFVIGHIGRFMFQKNHDFLVDIFAEVHKKNENSVLLLIGDGPLKDKIEEKVKKLGLTDSVIFTGNRKDVNELYQAMDCFVFPSNYEGLGMVLVEAQISGLPCVASEAVPRDTKISNKTEFLPLGDAGEWCESILNITKTDNRKSVYSEKYDIKKYADRLENFYVCKSCK